MSTPLLDTCGVHEQVLKDNPYKPIDVSNDHILATSHHTTAATNSTTELPMDISGVLFLSVLGIRGMVTLRKVRCPEGTAAL